MPKQRTDLWDIAKGVGIVLVYIGHNWTEPTFCGLSNWIYSFHMPLFFIVAGALSSSVASWRLFISKMWSSKLLPYFLFAFLGWGIAYISGNPRHSALTFGTTLLSGHPAGNGPLWFLPALAGGSLVVRLLGVSVAKFVLLFVVALSFALCRDALMGLPGMMITWPLSSCFLMVGKLSVRHLDKLIRQRSVVLILVAAVAMLITTAISIAKESAIMASYKNVNCLFLFSGVIGTIFVLSSSALIDRCQGVARSFICYVGRNSLYFFALDFCFRSLEGKVVHKLSPDMSTWPCFSGWSSGSIVVYSVIHLVLVTLAIPVVSRFYGRLRQKLS